jgi:hypothetical protein
MRREPLSAPPVCPAVNHSAAIPAILAGTWRDRAASTPRCARPDPAAGLVKQLGTGAVVVG